MIFLTFNFPPEIGGVGEYVYNLANCIKKQGIETNVIAQPVRIEVYKNISFGYPVFRVKTLRLPFSDPVPLNLLQLLRPLVKKSQTILHLNGHCNFLSFFAAFFCKVLGVPYIVTHHGEGLELSVISRLNGHIRRKILGKFVLKNSKLIIAVAETEVESIIKRYKIVPSKIKVIHNGILIGTSFPGNFGCSAINKKNNKEMILAGGILARWKGFDYLIRAIDLVIKEAPEVMLVITGKGPDESRLMNIVQSLKLKSFITFTGRLDHDSLFALYNSCDIFVLPSLYDVCPTSVLQAMACGKPVIATSNGGQKELVIDSVNGFIVNPADVKSLSKAILTLLSCRQLELKMGQESYRLAKEKFCWSTISKIITKEYRNALI